MVDPLIDPTKVVRTRCWTPPPVAGPLMKPEAVVAEKPEKRLLAEGFRRVVANGRYGILSHTPLTDRGPFLKGAPIYH
jgi:hypothetical protein